jgi:hypothetical protein
VIGALIPTGFKPPSSLALIRLKVNEPIADADDSCQTLMLCRAPKGIDYDAIGSGK